MLDNFTFRLNNGNIGNWISTHTRAHIPSPSIAFWHLPPNSVRIGYASESEGALIAAVHQRGQCPLEGLGTNKTGCSIESKWQVMKYAHKNYKHEMYALGKKKKVPSRFKQF